MNTSIIARFKFTGFRFITFLLAFCVAFPAFSQESAGNSNGADGFSPRETYPWYSQPWVWALIAAAIILVIAYSAYNGKKGKSKMESDSEEGTVHS
ncbi:hypothetical protein [Rubrolithibacter danxiaensis]|uniref:hypothetical protein n=1 Tax=Rubrolithibacter danxiaensis TaxID=3390805 RepID=UPI003BF7C85D